MTEQLLVDVGIAPRMRVLDAGCGSGDVSFMLATLVGPEGQVVGIDRDARPLATARGRDILRERIWCGDAAVLAVLKCDSAVPRC